MSSLSEIDPALQRARDLVLKSLPAEPALWVKPPGDTSPNHPESAFFHPWFPEHQRLMSQGWQSVSIPSGLDRTVLFGGKQKEENRRLLEACRSCSKEVYFVMPNEYGARSMTKEVEGVLDERVGKKSRLVVVQGDPAGSFLELNLEINSAGFYSTPGLFSWDRVDRGSELLAEALAGEGLRSPVVDLGGGWGYLVTCLSPELEVHLVEADQRGLEAAKRNLTSRTAHFHWADGTDVATLPQSLKGRVPTVITNPPFHTHRKADPVLGGAFVATAFWLLKRGGFLYLVGNTHLPYKKIMEEFFSPVDLVVQKDGFQVLRGKKA